MFSGHNVLMRPRLVFASVSTALLLSLSACAASNPAPAGSEPAPEPSVAAAVKLAPDLSLSELLPNSLEYGDRFVGDIQLSGEAEDLDPAELEENLRVWGLADLPTASFGADCADASEVSGAAITAPTEAAYQRIDGPDLADSTGSVAVMRFADLATAKAITEATIGTMTTCAEQASLYPAIEGLSIYPSQVDDSITWQASNGSPQYKSFAFIGDVLVITDATIPTVVEKVTQLVIDTIVARSEGEAPAGTIEAAWCAVLEDTRPSIEALESMVGGSEEAEALETLGAAIDDFEGAAYDEKSQEFIDEFRENYEALEAAGPSSPEREDLLFSVTSSSTSLLYPCRE